ncbi:peptidase, S54 family [Onchocerca flexuosa]|uniref:Peptidase, S54 family n=1 Tax=Onchocerca flexuosa TaxID=387005 RepID=A0A238C322_9BILA|nr:peptidase, S54 family [Onchocerca flexuosa]
MNDGRRHEYQMASGCSSWLSIFRMPCAQFRTVIVVIEMKFDEHLLQFDTNYDGYIATNDLKRFVRSSAASFGLSREEANILLKNVDKNGDHLLDFAEFCTLMSKAKKLRMRHVLFRAAQMVVPRSNRTVPFSYLQQYNCFPPPFFMLCISILEKKQKRNVPKIVIYVYYVVQFGTGIEMYGPVPQQSLLIFNPHKTSEVWRYLTYMFIHIGIIHLVFNVLTQIILGIPLELVHKFWRIALVYLSGVLAGSLLDYAIDPRIYLAGASGGVYALLAAHLAELLINWTEMEFALYRALVLAVLIISDVSLVIYHRYYLNSADKVSYISHFAGFMAGVLMGTIVLRNFRKKNWERVVWWIAFAIAGLSFSALVLLNIIPHI